MTRRVMAAAVAAALLLAGCQFAGDGPRIYKAHFTRAFQVFPGVKVKVLGIDVGRVDDVRNVEGAVEVTLKIEDRDVKVPADVEAAIVPVSLLGERYIQLLPAYEGGPELAEGSTIPLERTGAPAEADELLRALQNYLGELDPEKVEKFVTTTADVIEGRGERLNDLIASGTEVLETLAGERDELADMIVQFNTITQRLAARGDALARLIRTYDTVGGTIIELRSSLEGTITGLSDAAAALASLLGDHRPDLDADIRTLTRTTRTLSRNVETFARTGKWAKRLFRASSRAMDTEQDWLRLSNQGRPLTEMIMWRLQDRLVGLCLRLDLAGCAQPRHWRQTFPELFCIGPLPCRDSRGTPAGGMKRALRELPREVESMLDRTRNKDCNDARNPKRCRDRKKAAKDADPSRLEDVIEALVNAVGEDAGGGV